MEREVDLDIYSLISEENLEEVVYGEDEGEEEGNFNFLPSSSTSLLSDEERFEKMYKDSINTYESILSNEDVDWKTKKSIADTLMEMYGRKGKMSGEKTYNLIFGTDYMEKLHGAAEAFKTTLEEGGGDEPLHTPAPG